MKSKNAIALLITLIFIIAITASIGLGFKYIKESSKEVVAENFIYQSKVSVDDILTILKKLPELKNISKDSFTSFLEKAKDIPFKTLNLDIHIQIQSARSRFNINNLINNNKIINQKTTNALREYFSKNMINNDYVDILLDNMAGVSKDNSYNSDIFNQEPYLFRDYIASKKHLLKINNFYKKTYHDNNLKNINFNKLFYFSDRRDLTIDLNHANIQTWEMILGVDVSRAQQLYLASGSYAKLDDLKLSIEEKEALSRFKISFFEPIIEVTIQMTQNNEYSKVRFEYNIKNKKGSNFTYDI